MQFSEGRIDLFGDEVHFVSIRERERERRGGRLKLHNYTLLLLTAQREERRRRISVLKRCLVQIKNVQYHYVMSSNRPSYMVYT